MVDRVYFYERRIMDKEKEKHPQHVCGEHCEVWSRVTGYFRPVSSWNHGKKEEFKDRAMYQVDSCNKQSK